MLLIICHIVVWWRVWILNVVPSWNILQFAILIGSPLSLYLAATALVSSEPDKINDWGSYFADRGRWVFAALTAVVAFGLLRAYFILGVTPVWWSFFALVFVGGGALSKRRDVHIGVISALIVFLSLLLARDFTAV